MTGFTGFNNGTLMASNVDFRQVTPVAPQMIADGQLLIGSSISPFIGAATLTAGTGVSIVNGHNSITISLTGGGSAVEHLTGTTGGQLNPDGSNNFNLLAGTVAAGTTPVAIAGSGSTLTTNIQKSQAVASADATKIGLSNFNSTQFSVDANGFVSSITGGFTWVDVTTATQNLAVQTGYVTDHTNVTYTLPATANLGDQIRIVGKLGITTIAQNANQQILISSASSTVGATGSVAGTNVGDCIWLVCVTAGASTVWRSESLMGNWTVT